MFMKYYEDRQAQEIMQGKGNKQVKMDQLKLLVFGERPEMEPLDIK